MSADTITVTGLTLHQVEREVLRLALARHGGNRDAVARALGISRSTVFVKLDQHGLRETK